MQQILNDQKLFPMEAVIVEQFHSWQISQLKQGGVDFIIAETLPSVEEATGIARALQRSCPPYFISFVISRDGRVLDGCCGTNEQHLNYLVNYQQ